MTGRIIDRASVAPDCLDCVCANASDLTLLSSSDNLFPQMSNRQNHMGDSSIETLLELDGEVFPMENGYWTKFEARRIEPKKHVPHGILYSFTLHDRNSIRVLGFDNAHAHRHKKKKYGARNITWDHEHRGNRVHPYRFVSASQLLEDFWIAVHKIIK